MKKMIAVREGCIRGDESPTTLLQGFQTLGIRSFKGCDLLRGKPLGPYHLVFSQRENSVKEIEPWKTSFNLPTSL
jgi:hypothetical protein